MARQSDPDDAGAGVIELVPPGSAVPPGPRTRANVGLPAVPGGSGDPDMVPGRGLFAPPERFDQRPFSAAEAAKVVTEAAVETLRARGEPARMERLFGEILVGLDRSGQLRRLATGGRPADAPGGPAAAPTGTATNAAASSTPAPDDASVRTDGGDPVERLLALIRDELTRPDQRRVVEIEPGRWWLGDEADRMAAAAPLADRVEWAVFSLLSTAGPLSEAAFYERMATMFSGHDLPDETLVRACLESYRSLASTPDRLLTGDDLLKRSQEHSELLASITEGGHRMGMRVWLAEREQARRHGHGTLGDLLDDRERNAYLGSIGRPDRGPRRDRCHLVHPEQGRLPVRGRVDGHPRRATAAAPCPDRIG